MTTPRLLRILATAQLLVAHYLWSKDVGIALVFVAIAAGLFWESYRRRFTHRTTTRRHR